MNTFVRDEVQNIEAPIFENTVTGENIDLKPFGEFPGYHGLVRHPEQCGVDAAGLAIFDIRGGATVGKDRLAARRMTGHYTSDGPHGKFLRGIRPQYLSPAEYASLLGPLEELITRPEAEPMKAMVAPKPMQAGDIYYLAWAAGGGYGDPLQREPERVLKDVRAGILSRERCRDTYGVVIDENHVDNKATMELCAHLRALRLAEARYREHSTA